ncbi:sodium/hydrogen exchanger family protein [Brucella grignonensis]|uniref:Sodium/hydrogen exchanger family protein n=1 Tax=Brucella grignonensis TaxID=94627 RepID=A0A256F1J4_9HYPH|nr:sodium/hydrogen exchanger family protein [Brucella grignonensis]
MIASSILLAWISYLLGEFFHVSGVIATVTTGLIASWYQHTVFNAAIRMRGTSFWTVLIFMMEASVFILIGLSLRDVVERAGGFGTVVETMGLPVFLILIALIVSRFVWVFACDYIIRLCNMLGFNGARPIGLGGAVVVSWAGVRGVVTLALALSLPAAFPSRDLILVTAFAVIAGTVLVQGTTLGRIITWVKLPETESERAKLTMSQAEAAMAQVQLTTIEALAYDEAGNLVHPQLLARYQKRATAIIDYAERTEEYMPMLHAHFDAVLEIVAAGRGELLRLHRIGDIDDETLHELERDLDLEELSAISAKS